MSDRELLELAAKAAGKIIEWKKCAAHLDDYELTAISGPWVKGLYWNPLTNDEAALRLAVDLDIEFYQGDDDGPAAFAGYWGKFNRKDDVVTRMFCTEQIDDDKYASTRRAIVRAAAEIGKAMEDKRK